MTDKIIKRLHAVSFSLIFIAFFYGYLLTPLWDYDFWWHIATGRYIATEGHLPQSDPFSYTSVMEENKNVFPEREVFFLKQYWFAQVIFYFIFSLFGSSGMIITRSLLLLLTVLTVSWRLRRDGVSFYINFVLTFLLFMLSLRSLGERPVLFSMLFTALVIFLLEEFRERKGRLLFLLVPLLLVWANMHGAFVLGIIIISLYMLSEALKLGLRRSELTQKDAIVFFSATLMAILVTYINPCGWDAFSMSLNPKYDIFQKGIQEYMSPLAVYKEKIGTLDYNYAAIAALFPLVVIIRNRRMDLAHFLVLLGFFVMSAKAGRFIFFYGIIASMLLGKELGPLITGFIEKRLSAGTYHKIQAGFALAAIISTALFVVGLSSSGKPRLNVARQWSVPEKAVDFIEKNKLQGNIFNDYGYGGYLAWRLYPNKTFIDSRTLNLTVTNEYGWVIDSVEKVEGIRTANEKTPLWEGILNHYKISYMFLSITDIYGGLHPIILDLAAGEKWVPVYIDKISIIFVKNIDANREIISEYKMADDYVYNVLIYKLAALTQGDRINPRSLVSLGKLFSKVGRVDDAVKAYRLAAERLHDPDLMKRIEQMDAIIAQQGTAGGKENRSPQERDNEKSMAE
ncbi:MAG: hypothetical protein HZB62_12720 [Nitrospirae bacterium]|nr:hypothetical protein [Nitrospirota bacterium]